MIYAAYYIVLKIGFSKKYFSGSENSKVVNVTVVMGGGTAKIKIEIPIHFSEMMAQGQLICLCSRLFVATLLLHRK